MRTRYRVDYQNVPVGYRMSMDDAKSLVASKNWDPDEVQITEEQWAGPQLTQDQKDYLARYGSKRNKDQALRKWGPIVAILLVMFIVLTVGMVG
jgi:hypothetical protein